MYDKLYISVHKILLSQTLGCSAELIEMGMEGETAGLIIGMLMALIVTSVLITNTNTDAILGSSTASVGPIITIAMTAFTIAAIAIIAYIGRWIIGIFS